MILEDTKMKKVKGKKRFFLITCLMLLCAVAGIGGVLAYFTDSEQTNNKLKVAGMIPASKRFFQIRVLNPEA